MRRRNIILGRYLNITMLYMMKKIGRNVRDLSILSLTKRCLGRFRLFSPRKVSKGTSKTFGRRGSCPVAPLPPHMLRLSLTTSTNILWGACSVLQICKCLATSYVHDSCTWLITWGQNPCIENIKNWTGGSRTTETLTLTSLLNLSRKQNLYWNWRTTTTTVSSIMHVKFSSK